MARERAFSPSRRLLLRGFANQNFKPFFHLSLALPEEPPSDSILLLRTLAVVIACLVCRKLPPIVSVELFGKTVS